MIIIGYQGIGKSSISGKGSNRIDLESGNFWHNGMRPDDWYIYYCQIADHLSKQGFTVFTSSHKLVREELANSKEDIWVVYPSLSLKDEWVEKLKKRYEQTQSEKDYKAWKNAEQMYDDNINDLKSSPFRRFEITSMDYDLYRMVKRMYCVTESGT